MNELIDQTYSGERIIIFNGMHITDQCRFENGNIILPDWVAKELDDGFKELVRRKKVKNRLLRFFGLYKSGCNNRITITGY